MLVLVAGASPLALPQVPVDFPDQAPTFYFTRLVYTQNPFGGRRGRGRGVTMAPPAIQFRCPEFGGGNFFPPQGWGWATDYPGGDCKFMGAIHRLTGIRVHPDPNVLEIHDKDLYKFPFVYAVEVGQMFLDDDDAARLREYLLRGGFMHVDDFWGPDEFANFEDQIFKVFPDRKLEPLPLSHPVFHTFFDINEVMQIPNRGNGCANDGQTWEDNRDRNPVVYGISDDDDRLMVLVTYNSDLGDAWEYMDLPCYPVKYSGQAYRMGLNFMIYAMTH
ncbi:MAG TPA: DUF4159 domain-containing protein [Terriglobia bacterium]|nr:DUF4159 domain-containing protein [Terriglobia bacterium]